MGNVTLLDIFVCFIHLIWYFAGLFSELSLLVLSGSISRLAGFGLPSRVFTSILIIGGILMILCPFQPQYDSHEYHESANAYLYEALEYHLYRQNQPPVISDNYLREIGRKKFEEDRATLQITFNDAIAEDNEGISTIIQRLSDDETLNEFPNAEDVRLEEIKVIETPEEAKIIEMPKQLNLLTIEKFSKIQPSEIKSTDVEIVNDIESKNLKPVGQINDIALSYVSTISSNEIVSNDSSSSNIINSFKRDTIERIEKIVSVIEPDLTSENSHDQLANVSSREPSEQIEEFLSIIDTSDIDLL